MCTHPVSDRLQAIFATVGVMSVPKLVPLNGDINWEAVREIRKQYRPELNLCARMFEYAECVGQPVGILGDDPRWTENGLHLLSHKERRLIRRLCEFDKHPCLFNGDGLVLSPKVKKIHPLARPSALAS